MKKKQELQMEEETKIVQFPTDITKKRSNSVRVKKDERIKTPTQIHINKSIVGDSIEIMLERLREGEGEEVIQDRDLVYNDDETSVVNPVTNIRSDKFELMLEEKIGEYEHKQRKLNKEKTEEVEKIVKEENEKLNTQEGTSE